MQNPIINTVLTLARSTQKNIFLLFSLLFFSLSICPLRADDPSSLPLVAISQITQHASLDQEREGIIAALKEAGYEDGKTMRLVYENAQGNITTANLIASHFAGLKPTVVIAISTPSAKALVKPMIAQGVPLVFTAITDPLGEDLVTSVEERPEPVTGVSDALGAGPQLDLIRQLVPSVKNIGVVYNLGETNSVKAVKDLKEAAAQRGLTLIEATTDKPSEIVLVTTKLVGFVDAIYVPNDNTAVASIESIVTLGKKFKIPVLVGDAGSVERGALAAYAYDRVALGRKAGALAVKILKGQKAGSLAIDANHPLILMVNLKAAKEMGVSIPDRLKSQAKAIGEKP